MFRHVNNAFKVIEVLVVEYLKPVVLTVDSMCLTTS